MTQSLLGSSMLVVLSPLGLPSWPRPKVTLFFTWWVFSFLSYFFCAKVFFVGRVSKKWVTVVFTKCPNQLCSDVMGANIKIVLVFVAGTQNLIQSLERSAFKGAWLLENVFYCQLTLRPLLAKIGLRRWRQKPFKLLKKWSHLWKRRSVLCRQQSRSAHTPDTTFFAYDLKKVATSFSDNGSFWAFTGTQPFKTF